MRGLLGPALLLAAILAAVTVFTRLAADGAPVPDREGPGDCRVACEVLTDEEEPT